MNRSYRKPIYKLENDGYFKKLYNKKLRLKKDLYNNMFFKKCFCSWDICDLRTRPLTKEEIEDWYKDKTYKILRK